jgi:hypothetical protein
MSDVVCGCLAGGRAGLLGRVQPKHRIGSNDPVDTRVYPKSCCSRASSGGVNTTRMVAVAFDLNRVDTSAQVARFERSAASAPPIDAHGATLAIAVHDELAGLLGPLSTGLVVERERRRRVQKVLRLFARGQERALSRLVLGARVLASFEKGAHQEETGVQDTLRPLIFAIESSERGAGHLRGATKVPKGGFVLA